MRTTRARDMSKDQASLWRPTAIGLFSRVRAAGRFRWAGLRACGRPDGRSANYIDVCAPASFHKIVEGRIVTRCSRTPDEHIYLSPNREFAHSAVDDEGIRLRQSR